MPARTGDVVAAARAWIGTPYRHQASARGAGCDCLGLLRGVWREVCGPERREVPPYSPDWGEAERRETLLEAVSGVMIPAREVAPGAVLIFRLRRDLVARHSAIVVGAGRMIHATEHGGVLEDTITDAWLRRRAGLFLYPAQEG